MSKQWILRSNDSIDEYVAEEERLQWNVTEGIERMSIGDGVFIMGSKGIIALGKLTGTPEYIDDDIVVVMLKIRTRFLIPNELLLEDPLLSDLKGLSKTTHHSSYYIDSTTAVRLSHLLKNMTKNWDHEEYLAALWAYIQSSKVSKDLHSPVAQASVAIGRSVADVYDKVVLFSELHTGKKYPNEVDPSQGEIWTDYYDQGKDILDKNRVTKTYLNLWGVSSRVSR